MAGPKATIKVCIITFVYSFRLLQKKCQDMQEYFIRSQKRLLSAS